MMDWVNVGLAILAGVGGTSGLLSLYKARPQKTSLELDNFKKLYDELQEERMTSKKENDEYREKTDKKIEELNTKVDELSKSKNKRDRAINAAFRCRFPEKMSQCPVINTMDMECQAQLKKK